MLMLMRRSRRSLSRSRRSLSRFEEIFKARSRPRSRFISILEDFGEVFLPKSCKMLINLDMGRLQALKISSNLLRDLRDTKSRWILSRKTGFFPGYRYFRGIFWKRKHATITKFYLGSKKAKIGARDAVWWCSLYGNRFATYNIYRKTPFRALWTILKKLGSDFLFHLPVTRQVDSENSGTTCRARVSRRSYPAPDPGPSTWTCFPGTPPPFLISRDRTPYQIPDLDLLPWTPFSYHKFQSSRYWGGV